MSDQPRVLPADGHNQRLVELTHPSGWTNPTPSGRYNLVVIGGGTAGLVCAAGAAGLGGKVALIERSLLGGDCLGVGCVPSKCLISAARVAGEMARGPAMGINLPGEPQVDFAAVMDRMRSLRARIAEHDSVQRFTDLGVDIYLGEGRFTSPDRIEVDGVCLEFSRAVIATGSKPGGMPFAGLEETGYLTNETIFSLTELPSRLAVLGTGPIGCELAQSFQRFGSAVTMIGRSKVMSREDQEAVAIVAHAMTRDGLDLRLGYSVEKVEADGNEKLLHLKDKQGERSILTVDEILVGAGRHPVTEGLGLEAAEVEFDPRAGVVVDDHLRTTNHKVYAAGDVCMKHKFTHAADAAARIVIQNALFAGHAKASSLTMPWCTYTDPELAQVGLSEKTAGDAGVEVDVFKVEFSDIDRAIADGQEEGLAKILVNKGTDNIVGATIVAAHAGEMISEVSVAMAGGVGLKKLATVIHPYPTQAEAIRKAADAYNRTRLTPRTKKFLSGWLSLRR